MHTSIKTNNHLKFASIYFHQHSLGGASITCLHSISYGSYANGALQQKPKIAGSRPFLVRSTPKFNGFFLWQGFIKITSELIVQRTNRQRYFTLRRRLHHRGDYITSLAEVIKNQISLQSKTDHPRTCTLLHSYNLDLDSRP